MSCSAIVSSEGGEPSNASFHNNNGNHQLRNGEFDLQKLNARGPVNLGGGMQPHPTKPDKLVTASGAVITRPKSK